MRYVLLGRSGLRVSEAALGTMTIRTTWGWGADADECRAMFEVFADAGGTFVDTASNYTDGESEEIVGRLLSGRRDRFVVATKYTLTADVADPNAGGNHRKSLVRSLDASLRRLRTDYVDVLWLHMWDGLTPLEEVVRALDDQVRLGKVLYVGMSDTPAWVISRANAIADLRGWSPFIAVQLPYNVAARDAERELLPMAAACELGVIAWGVLGAGVLTGKAQHERRWPDDAVTEREERIVATLRRIATDHGCTPAQAAIAWLRQRSHRPRVIPILGARRIEQLCENLEALELRLGDDAWSELDEAGRPALGFPGDFLTSSGVRTLIFGDSWASLETSVSA